MSTLSIKYVFCICIFNIGFSLLLYSAYINIYRCRCRKGFVSLTSGLFIGGIENTDSHP